MLANNQNTCENCILINQPIIFLIEFLSNNEQYVYIYTQDVPKMSRHP